MLYVRVLAVESEKRTRVTGGTGMSNYSTVYDDNNKTVTKTK
jgi:hypothetical protein